MITEETIDSSFPKPFYAATANHDLGGIILSETRYRSSVVVPMHRHEQHAYFSLVLRGGYTERSPRAVLDLKPSTIIFHPVGSRHLDEFYALDSRLFAVKLKASWLEQVAEREAILDRSVVRNKGPLVRLAFQLYREFNQPDTVSALMVEGLVMEMLAESWRCSTGDPKDKPRWLELAKEMVQDQFSENLTLLHVARSVGVHPVHLARVFRRHFGCTVGEHIQQLRVEAACRRLSASNISLALVAAECGFCDQSHFCRVFKRLIGMTPREYRALFSSH